MKNKQIIIIIIIIIAIIVLSIIYNTFPRLQLNGNQTITLSYREQYIEPGVIVKNVKTNYVNKIKIDSNIDTKQIGNYYIDYSLKFNGKTLHVRRNVKIIDNIAPVIKLKGDQIIEIPLNEEYKEPGYTAYDEYDGDLTEKVQTIGKVDNEHYGEYIITYKVKDNSDNVTEINRIIKVKDKIKPEIICETDTSVLEKENIITGCKAIDNFDGDITKKIEIQGEYNKDIPGTYEIILSVKDDADNQTKKEHKIIIKK